MAKKNMNELKRRALLAKQRMKMGYWEQMMKDRDKLMSEATTFEAQKFVSDYQREKLNREYSITVSKSASRDEQLYEKVCTILDSEELVTNPIARLIDKTVYDKMDNEAKQLYILELAAKFRELNERYYKERMGKSS